MTTKPYLVVYNLKPNDTFNCKEQGGFEMILFENKLFNSQLIQTIISSLDGNKPIVIINAEVELPAFWSQRLLEGVRNHSVDLCSALTCQLNSLSPLTDNDKFTKDLSKLDNLIYLLQRPKLIYTNQINFECFVVKNKVVLKNLDQITYRACNNLLVQSHSNGSIRSIEKITLGNQNPLPAHALAELQWRLKEQTSTLLSDSSYPLLDEKPIMLHITMNWGGGVQHWINTFSQHEKNHHHLILVSNGEFYRESHGEILNLHFQRTDGVLIKTFELESPIKATCVEHLEYRALLKQLTNQFQISQIVVSSLIGHSMECLNTNIPTTRVFHDYFPSWPSLSAQLDRPKITKNDVVLALEKSQSEPFGTISESDYIQWRDKIHHLYQTQSINLVAPSQSVIENLTKIDKDVFKHTQIIPHAIQAFDPVRYNKTSSVFQILVLGRINFIKGQQLIEEIMNQLVEDYYFTLLGAGKNGEKYKNLSNVTVIEDYENGALEMLLQEIEPDLALITSQTSETFSYTLSELQQAGICTISTKFGALKNRIVDSKTGFLCENNSIDFCKKIIQLKNNPDLIIKVRENLVALEPITFEEVAQQYASVFSRKIKPVYGLVNNQSNNNVLAKKLHALHKEKLRIEVLLDEAELSLIERTKWGKKLTHNLKKAEKNIQLERTEAEYLKELIAQEAKRMTAEIDTLKFIVDDKQSQLEKIGNELNITQQEKNSVEQELSSKKQELSSKKQELSSKKQELSSVYQSRSWRITKPIRRFTTWGRHKRNALKYRVAQIKTVPARIVRSIKTRGLRGTLIAVKQKSQKPQATKQTSVELTQNFQAFSIDKKINPNVSIIIPVYNHFEHTYNCLKSIAKLGDKATFEVIVIDDCSTDETQKLIKHISGINYHRQNQNGGFIESCNTGAKLAKSQYLMFLNNDTVVYNDWLDSLLGVFNNYHDAGLVGSKLVYPNNQLQEAGGIVFSDASGWNYGRLGDPDEPQFNHLREVDYCSGASILIRKELFEQLGQFDRRYKPAYYEDTDLAFAVRNIGKKVYYQPASKVTHFEGISSGTDLSQGMKKYQVVNQTKFKKKWQNQLKNQLRSGMEIEMCRIHGQPKRILIFDACTPTPDQDSGSLRMINLIKILKELRYHIIFMPENFSYNDKYTQDLQQLGVECIYNPYITNPVDYLKDKGQFLDVVMLSRYYVAEQAMPFIREYCPKAQIIFDTVDLHYIRERRMAELNNDSKLAKMAEETKVKELAVAKACDLTLVVSPYEVEVLNKDIPDVQVKVLSNIHEIYGCRKSFAQRKDIMFIGGYQHTPNVDAVEWFVSEVFPLIEKQLPELKFHIVGSKAPKHIQAMARENIVFQGFVENIEPIMDDIRIAVAPLRYGAGVKGKVNMSMSYGQPVIGTKVAVEGMFTENEKDCLMAETPQEFAQKVIRLYQDEALWNTISRGGLANVENYFSFESAKKSIENLLSS